MPTSPRPTRPTGLRLATIGAVAGVALVLLAGCGSSSKTTVNTTTTANTGTTAAGSGGGGVTIGERSVGQLGMVLVNQNGQTLYLLTSEQGGKLTCTDANGCTPHWPPTALPTGVSAATAASGVDASKLGTVKSPSGDTWVTYGGWPLYTFAGDSGPGTANGEGISSFGGTWEVVTVAGTGVAPSSSGATTTTAASGGYHY